MRYCLKKREENNWSSLSFYIFVHKPRYMNIYRDVTIKFKEKDAINLREGITEGVLESIVGAGEGKGREGKTLI